MSATPAPGIPAVPACPHHDRTHVNGVKLFPCDECEQVICLEGPHDGAFWPLSFESEAMRLDYHLVRFPARPLDSPATRSGPRAAYVHSSVIRPKALPR